MVLRDIFIVKLYGILRLFDINCSTEDDNALPQRSHGAGILESEAEAESVVESVVRGEKEASGSCEKDVNGEADESGVVVPEVRSFSERGGFLHSWPP